MALDRQAIKVLDHGYIQLIDSMGGDLSIVRSARVSFDAAWRAGKDKGSDEKLIHYLYRNGHNTPFESVTMTFEIKAPIFVLRQWMRHRVWSFNEISARYSVMRHEYYVPDADKIGVQSNNNKQCRDFGGEYPDICVAIDSHCEKAFNLYNNLIDDGVPREIARTVLPLATYSHCFGTVNLHNLFRFLSERLHPHAQYEIRVYAEAMLKLIRPIAPVAVAAFKENRQ